MYNILFSLILDFFKPVNTHRTGVPLAVLGVKYRYIYKCVCTRILLWEFTEWLPWRVAKTRLRLENVRNICRFGTCLFFSSPRTRLLFCFFVLPRGYVVIIIQYFRSVFLRFPSSPPPPRYLLVSIRSRCLPQTGTVAKKITRPIRLVRRVIYCLC